MERIDQRIPVSSPAFGIVLAYLDTYGRITDAKTDLAFLQRVRSHKPESRFHLGPEPNRYRTATLPRAILRAITLLETCEFDFALRPPSSRDDAVPYLNAFIDARPHTIDLSSSFARAIGAKKAGENSSFEEVRDALLYTGTKDLSAARSILIVDDIFSEGKTAAAVIDVLRRKGLPSEAKITLFAPLWVRKSDLDLSTISSILSDGAGEKKHDEGYW